MNNASSSSFSSKFGFLMAAAGSAIGLGAIWKFPYIVGTSGGGAFVLLFIAFSVLLGAPLLIAELLIGKSSKAAAVKSFVNLGHKKWRFIGYLGIITSVLILSFYAVIGGWVLIYTVMSLVGQVQASNTETASALFSNISSNPFITLLGQWSFLLITLLIVNRGVSTGIEKVSKILMPVFFLFLLAIMARSLTLSNAIEGIKFFLTPDFSAITSESVLFALGQAFFSLSLGITGMLTYGSYMKKETKIVNSSLIIVTMNIIVSMLAGLAIFPAVFSVGLDPAEGPALLFIILPTVFQQIPLGSLFLCLFFLLFSFAALTSSIALLEISTAGISEQLRRKKTGKKKINLVLTVIIVLVGIPNALSFSTLSNFTLNNKTYFDVIDFATANILMPIGALLTAIFVGYILKKGVYRNELKGSFTKFENMWLFALRIMVPVTVAYIMFENLFN